MDFNTLTGPYKATKLWNHAVTLFCNEMPLYRQRRGMKHYDNCFTGAQAISWFHKALAECPCFDQRVTKKQTQQLLEKFLTASVFHNIKGHSRFKKGGLYEFVKENVNTMSHSNMLWIEKIENEHEKFKNTTLQRNLKLQEKRKTRGRGPKFDRCHFQKQYTDFPLKHQARESKNLSSNIILPEDIWMRCVLNRIQDLLIGEDISSKLPDYVSAKWVMMNGSPEYSKIRTRMFLPCWVATAMWNVVSSAQNQTQNSYPSFTEDVVNTVFDYFNYLSMPVIPLEFYDIIIHIFLQLMKIDENTRKKMYLQNPFNRKSMENLLLNMSTPIRHVNVSKMDCSLLPANSCFETAFTSDMPITRIVPQRSVDTLHLTVKPLTEVSPFSEMLVTTTVHQSVHSRPLRRSRSSANSIQNSCIKYFPILRSRSNRKAEQEQFIEEDDDYQLPSTSNSDADKPLPKKTGCIDNYGLSKSMEDLNPENITELDLKEAIDSLQVLVDAAKSHSKYRRSTISLSSVMRDDETLSDSGSDTTYEPVVYRRRLPLKQLLKYSGHQGFQDVRLLPATYSLANSVYHLLFTLVPPECRSTVSLVLKFLNHLCKNSDQSTQIFLHFSDRILRPSEVVTASWDPSFSKMVLHYLMLHGETIFGDLPEEFVAYIDSRVEKLYEKPEVPENNPNKPDVVKTGKETVKGNTLRALAEKIKNLRL